MLLYLGLGILHASFWTQGHESALCCYTHRLSKLHRAISNLRNAILKSRKFGCAIWKLRKLGCTISKFVCLKFRNWFPISQFLICATQFQNCVNLQIARNTYIRLEVSVHCSIQLCSYHDKVSGPCKLHVFAILPTLHPQKATGFLPEKVLLLSYWRCWLQIESKQTHVMKSTNSLDMHSFH